MKPLWGVRWGFRFTLVTVLGLALIAIILFGWHNWTQGDIGLYSPTRIYAEQAGGKLVQNISGAIKAPPELIRWRNTGKFDSSFVFPKAALFWFTYNLAQDSFIFRAPDSTLAILPEAAGWQGRLEPVLRPLLKEKKAGQIFQRIKKESGDYHIEGRIFADEPRAVAMVTDLAIFRGSVLPAILEKARSDFPWLDGFVQPAWGSPPTSWLFILIRDDRDSIICKLGEPGQYLRDGKTRAHGFIKSYPTTYLGFTMDVILLDSLDARFQAIIFRSICIFTVVWILTMILWARAEVRLVKAKKER